MYGKLYDTILRSKQNGTASKVTLIQQRIQVLRIHAPVYHVGLVLQTGDQRRIFEHGPIKYDPLRSFDDAITVPLPSVRHTIDDLLAFQDTLPDTYILGIRDCRHHLVDLLNFLYQ